MVRKESERNGMRKSRKERMSPRQSSDVGLFVELVWLGEL